MGIPQPVTTKLYQALNASPHRIGRFSSISTTMRTAALSFARTRLGRPSIISRYLSTTAVRARPTAISRAEKAADLKTHPESAMTQQKLPDRLGNRHWSEENATESEKDIRADKEEPLPEEVIKKGPTGSSSHPFGDRNFGAVDTLLF